MPRVVTRGRVHEQLSAKDVDNGAVAFLLFPHLNSGSAGGIDLHRLLRAYLLDLAKHAVLNAIVFNKAAG